MEHKVGNLLKKEQDLSVKILFVLAVEMQWLLVGILKLMFLQVQELLLLIL